MDFSDGNIDFDYDETQQTCILHQWEPPGVFQVSSSATTEIGLFATRDLNKGEFIGVYEGLVLASRPKHAIDAIAQQNTSEELLPMNARIDGASNVFEVSYGKLVKPDECGNYTYWIVPHEHVSQLHLLEHSFNPNFQLTGMICTVTRPVANGEQLTLQYGLNYWSRNQKCMYTNGHENVEIYELSARKSHGILHLLSPVLNKKQLKHLSAFIKQLRKQKQKSRLHQSNELIEKLRGLCDTEKCEDVDNILRQLKLAPRRWYLPTTPQWHVFYWRPATEKNPNDIPPVSDLDEDMDTGEKSGEEETMNVVRVPDEEEEEEEQLPGDERSSDESEVEEVGIGTGESSVDEEPMSVVEVPGDEEEEEEQSTGGERSSDESEVEEVGIGTGESSVDEEPMSVQVGSEEEEKDIGDESSSDESEEEEDVLNEKNKKDVLFQLFRDIQYPGEKHTVDELRNFWNAGIVVDPYTTHEDQKHKATELLTSALRKVQKQFSHSPLVEETNTGDQLPPPVEETDITPGVPMDVEKTPPDKNAGKLNISEGVNNGNEGGAETPGVRMSMQEFLELQAGEIE